MIDLTFGITSKLKVFPGSPQPSFIKWSKFDVHGYESEAMFLSTHTGTHLDALPILYLMLPTLTRLLLIDFFARMHYY